MVYTTCNSVTVKTVRFVIIFFRPFQYSYSGLCVYMLSFMFNYTALSTVIWFI